MCVKNELGRVKNFFLSFLNLAILLPSGEYSVASKYFSHVCPSPCLRTLLVRTLFHQRTLSVCLDLFIYNEEKIRDGLTMKMGYKNYAK